MFQVLELTPPPRVYSNGRFPIQCWTARRRPMLTFDDGGKEAVPPSEDITNPFLHLMTVGKRKALSKSLVESFLPKFPRDRAQPRFRLPPLNNRASLDRLRERCAAFV